MAELNPEAVKQYQLAILEEVDQWCRTHDVRYFLAYGTLLGAVRHQGYIPWDDDIDICMLRPDYERFIRQFNNGRQDSYRVLHSSIDKKYPFEYAKVHDLRTKLVEYTGYQYDIGINIDVFVLDAVPGGAESVRPMIRRRKKYVALTTAKNMYITNKKRALWKSAVFHIGKAVTNVIPFSVATTGIDRIARKYITHMNSEWLANICMRDSTEKQIFRRDWFEEAINVGFENQIFCAPAHYDEVLTTWYGDYMCLPPEEERITHHAYSAYLR